MFFVRSSWLIIALLYCGPNKLSQKCNWNIPQVSVSVFCIWSLSIYTRTLRRTLCNFSNSLIKWNISLAVMLSLFNSFSVSFSKFSLENVVCTSVSLLSVNSILSRPNRILSMIFYHLVLWSFSNQIVQKNQIKTFPFLDANLECSTSAFLLYLIYLYSRLWMDIKHLFFLIKWWKFTK